MTMREFFNAWIGHEEEKREKFAGLFEIERFGSFYNVFSKEQASALKKASNPYRNKSVKKSNRPLTMDEVAAKMPRTWRPGE